LETILNMPEGHRLRRCSFDVRSPHLDSMGMLTNIFIQGET